MTLPTIKSLDDLTAYAGGVIYVRYSIDHEQDIERGYSLNWQDHSREPGLSAQVIRPEDWDTRSYVAKLLVEYSRLLTDGGYGWIAHARCVGSDGDGCPSITDVTPLAVLDSGFVARVRRFVRDLNERDRTHRGVNDDRPWPRIDDYEL